MTVSAIDNKKLVTAANFLLSGVLAISCIFLIRDFISFNLASRLAGKGLQATVAPPSTRSRPVLFDYSVVTKNNVFGFPPTDLRPVTASTAQAPPASVSLIGTVSGAEGFFYAVVLRDSREELYKAGQMIPGVGYLKSIKKDSINIKAAQGGGDLALRLRDLAAVENAPAQGQAPMSSQGRFVSRAGQDSYVLDKSAVADAIQNPTKILADARMLPNMVNGKQEGFVMREIKPGGLFAALGLQNGDVLLKVNNNEISGPDMALRAFTALKGLDSVDLDVIRGGQKLTLTYQIK